MRPIQTLVVFVAAALCGCSSSSIRYTETPVESQKARDVPPVGVVAKAPVGDVLYTHTAYTSISGYRLGESRYFSFGLGKVAVASGDFVSKAVADDRLAYCTKQNVYVDPLAGPIKPACFIDADLDGRFEKVLIAPGAMWMEKEVLPPLPFGKSELEIQRPDSIKSELLYMGRSNNSLRLLYREYINDLARPAFSQDIGYGVVSTPTTISFKALRIEILRADNNGLEYRMLGTP